MSWIQQMTWLHFIDKHFDSLWWLVFWLGLWFFLTLTEFARKKDVSS